MDTTIQYMLNKEWENDREKLKKRYLLNLVRSEFKQDSLPNKIGSILIYNQIIEQFLKEIIETSVNYIKAEIWPSEVELKVDFENKTFGQLIYMFEQYATKENQRDVIISKLKDFNKKRNKVVHNLLTIENIEQLPLNMNSYIKLAEKIIVLLLEYNVNVCYQLEDLSNRVDWDILE